MKFAIRLKPGKRVKLDELPTLSTGGLDKAGGQERFAELGKELQALQELMYGASTHSVLLVVQGRDTAGKDGVVNAILSHVDAMGCQTTAFKAPSSDERSRDFLWRVHKAVPPRGMLGMFNRSHYEDVLVTRVNGLVPESVWRSRYKHINHFEQLLADTGTILLKCFLHISKQEQEERLLERELNPSKSWKLAVEDWKDRAHWDDYTRAYEDALEKCGSAAPWFVIPGDKKWFRNLAVMEMMVETLRPYRKIWEAALVERGERSKADLASWRAERSSTSGE